MEVEPNQKGEQEEAFATMGWGGPEHSSCCWETLSCFSKMLQPYILTFFSTPKVTTAGDCHAAAYFFCTIGQLWGEPYQFFSGSNGFSLPRNMLTFRDWIFMVYRDSETQTVKIYEADEHVASTLERNTWCLNPQQTPTVTCCVLIWHDETQLIETM